jgi:hypothetical protein
MPESSKPKFVPLNATAARITDYVVGNPVNTRLESGVGNCFPGLEMDLRNLERRFFPFLEVDFNFDTNAIVVVSVDIDGVANSDLPQSVQNQYQLIAEDMASDTITWTIDTITGTFGIFGRKTLTMATISPANSGEGGTPPDSWTAVRLLPPNEDVEVVLGRRDSSRSGASRSIKLKLPRAMYTDSAGVLSSAFEPGELSQSLCSPWTHDFRDCGCFYWASNHPDIVQPPAPEGQENDPTWQRMVPWERAERGTPDDPSPPASPLGDGRREMQYYEINQRWQELDIVIERRELRNAYRPGSVEGKPFATREELIAELQYAAGVELAAIQVYLTAAYSLKPESSLAGELKDDVNSAFAEIMRVAISEMRHLRIVNDILRTLNERWSVGKTFEPALQVAKEFPPLGTQPLPVAARPLDPDVLGQFIEIEKPSESIDGLYARILSSLGEQGFSEQAAAVRSVMAQGLDHYQTFLFVQEWLGRHEPPDYLNAAKVPKTGDKLHADLQTKYVSLLRTLRKGYETGLPAGASEIVDARNLMVNGIIDVCDQHRRTGVLLVFDPPSDPDFSPIARPTTDG